MPPMRHTCCGASHLCMLACLPACLYAFKCWRRIFPAPCIACTFSDMQGLTVHALYANAMRIPGKCCGRGHHAEPTGGKFCASGFEHAHSMSLRSYQEMSQSRALHTKNSFGQAYVKENAKHVCTHVPRTYIFVLTHIRMLVHMRMCVDMHMPMQMQVQKYPK